jgi:hypothetical protein
MSTKKPKKEPVEKERGSTITLKLSKAKIIKGIMNGSISEYNKTLTKDIRKQMVEYGFWWMKYKGIYPTVAPAGHLIPAGECQLRRTKRCSGYTSHLMTSYYGSDIRPSCHACWCSIGLDD